jgi:hypothetical protein
MKLKKLTLKQIFENEATLPATYNTELIEYLQKYNNKNDYVFSGVIMSNEVSKIVVKDKQFFIVNYDKTNEPGSHWVVIVKDGGEVYHFGSYGIPPIQSIKAKFSKYKLLYNDRPVQLSGTNICGHLCINFIEHMILLKRRTFYNFITECLKHSNRYKNDI